MSQSENEKRRAELLNEARVKRELAEQARVLALDVDEEHARAGLLTRATEFVQQATELEALAAVLAGLRADER
jgi:homoserine kinase